MKADAIDKTIRKTSTDPEKQANFLEDFSPFVEKNIDFGENIELL